MGLIIPEVTGAEVVLCPSGASALEMLANRSFDAIVLDLRMPHMSGPELFAALQPTNRDRVVFLTGDAVSWDAQEFLRASGRPWLLKPVDLDALARELKTVCAAHAQPPAR